MPVSSPILGGMMPPNPNPTSALTNDEFLRWSNPNSIPGFSDASNSFNGGSFPTNALTSTQGPIGVPSNQLTRRPVNHQLVATQRQPFDIDNTWATLGDDALLDPGASDLLDEEDNIDLLEEKATVAKREALAKRKQIPPFVQKLSSFLDEKKNTDLIRWSDKGDSFIVLDEDEFAKTLIPELFKHNNYASFVRQLNMYGFHKRVGLSDNSMKASERKNKSPSEYSNPYFRRGHPNLLWLINKPKGGAQKKKGGKAKTEDGAEVESDEDMKDTEEVTPVPGTLPKAITSSGETGPVQKREMGLVRQQLQEIQKQQHAISTAIARLRKDHNQLYQQAVAFQTLHDRHENSINAILSFLATIYNRSLDGSQGGPNFTQMFANAIPQDQRGDIVDMGDVTTHQSGGVSPVRRQRLLMAPPASTPSTAKPSPTPVVASPMGRSKSYQGQRTSSSGKIEELDNMTSESPKVKPEDVPSPQQEILNIINNTNAQNTIPGYKGGMPVDLPGVLSQYENSNSKSPLTSEQRNSMLSLIANTSSPPGNNNALVSPTPPPMPDLQNLAYTQSEIDELVRMQREQSAKLDEVSQLIQPLSPSGSIPGLSEQYFGGDLDGANAPNLDLDQYLDMGDYNGSGIGDNSVPFDFSTPQDSGTMFDFPNVSSGTDSTGIPAMGGRIIESTESSAAPSPPERRGGDDGNAPRSPLKRRRKE